MSMPLQVRRSVRETVPRRLLADEQALSHQELQLRQEVSRVMRETAPTEEPSDSSDDDVPSDEGSESEDDENTRPADPNRPQWIQQLHDVHPTLYDTPPVVNLPRHSVLTELGILQSFIDPKLIDTIVINTNQYATDRGAVKWKAVDAPTIWRYLAVRIRQGIVMLPELHMYWQDGYRDAYITQLMVRDRFIQIHRYFHIAPPVPRGVRQNIVEKTDEFLPPVPASVSRPSTYRAVTSPWTRP